jgi:hypothetical protein
MKPRKETKYPTQRTHGHSRRPHAKDPTDNAPTPQVDPIVSLSIMAITTALAGLQAAAHVRGGAAPVTRSPRQGPPAQRRGRSGPGCRAFQNGSNRCSPRGSGRPRIPPWPLRDPSRAASGRPWACRDSKHHQHRPPARLENIAPWTSPSWRAAGRPSGAAIAGSGHSSRTTGKLDGAIRPRGVGHRARPGEIQSSAPGPRARRAPEDGGGGVTIVTSEVTP